MKIAVPEQYTEAVENFLAQCEDFRSFAQYKDVVLASEDPESCGPELISFAFLDQFRGMTNDSLVSAITKHDTFGKPEVLLRMSSSAPLHGVLWKCSDETCRKVLLFICAFWARQRKLLAPLSQSAGVLEDQVEDTDERATELHERELIDRVEGFDYDVENKGEE